MSLTVGIGNDSRQNPLEMWRLSAALLRYPTEKAADPSLNLRRVADGDVAQAMVKKGIVEPIERGGHICLRFVFQSSDLETGNDLGMINLQQQASILIEP